MPESFSRFLLPAVLVAVPASGFWFSERRWRARPYFGFLVGAALFLLLRFTTVGVADFELDSLQIDLLGFGALAVLALVLRGRTRAAALAVAGLALLLVIADRRDATRLEATRWSQFLHPLHRHWVEPARIVDTPGEPHLIAVTHGVGQLVDTGLFYFFFGRELQNRLVHVPVTRDGAPLFDPGADDPRVSYDHWLKRIHEGGIEYVVALQPVSLEQKWMEAHPRQFRNLWGAEKQWGLFEVVRPRDEVRSRSR
jgi:hypothetical protein